MKLSNIKHLAIATYCISGLFLIPQKLYAYIIAGVILAIALGLTFKYRCSNCGKHFDLRFSKKTLTHCPRCREKVDWD